MLLKELVKPLLAVSIIGNNDIEINGIEIDSRRVKNGDLFICLTGFTVDGHEYAYNAVQNGAVALICEKVLPINVPQIIVKDSRFAMTVVSDYFFKHPSHRLKVIGVTGTNGKTTTTHLIEKLLEDQGHLSGLVGTIKLKIGKETYDVKNTTPDALELQRSFARMLEVGSEYAIMEVSSHALDIGRVKGIDYHIGVFTNLTQDHLDYHDTMERYRDAKGLLFSQLGNSYYPSVQKNKYAVLNADDQASSHFKKITAAQVITYGIDNEADVKGTNIAITAQGTSFRLVSFKGEIDIRMKMIGKFNIYNVLAAATVALIEGIPLEGIKKTVEEIEGVDGRFEPVNAGQDFAVIVDYAHTPDSLENVLKTIREFATGKVYCVFGAGGDRDKTKRPLMGEIAVNYSDFVIITSDNPRSEKSEDIIADILVGIAKATTDKSRYISIADRKSAIEFAVNHAQSGDIILIAGKGHETYQILQGNTIHFDDREVAREAIRSRMG